MKHLTRSIAVLAALASLAGCSTGNGQPQPSESATSTTPAIRLSAPPTSDRKDLTLVIDTTGIPMGTTGNLFAYGGTWNDPPATCAGDRPIASFQITKSGPMAVNVSVTQPGIYSWVLAAPGFTTPCNDPKMRTIVRATTRLSLNWGEVGFDLVPPIPVSKPFGYTVGAYVANGSQDAPEPWRVTVSWLGPFTGAPEAIAAGCGTVVPVAHRVDVQVSKDSKRTPVSTTPTVPGVYRVMATTPETNKVQAGTTPCDAESNFVTVVK